VVQELQDNKDSEHREKMLALIAEYKIKILDENKDAERLADIYIANNAVKAAYPTDTVHIAITAVRDMDFIVSLNFQHIVKQKTIVETGRINVQEGYRNVGISPRKALEHEND
jgi:Fe-S cluster assembly ATPase SufC